MNHKARPWLFLLAIWTGTFVAVVLAIEWRQDSVQVTVTDGTAQINENGDVKARLDEAGYANAPQPWVSPTLPPPRASMDLRVGESVELEGGGSLKIVRVSTMGSVVQIGLVLEGPHPGSVGYFMKSVANDGFLCPVSYGLPTGGGLAEGEKIRLSYTLECDKPRTFQLDDLLFKIP